MKNQRTCIVCRTTKDKRQLIKVVKNKDGEIKISTSNRDEGRGAYICNDKACVEKAEKTKALNRAFKTEVSSEILSELKKICE